MPVSEAYNMDCMDYLAQFPDKHFQLAIVDPPYGIKMSAKAFNERKPSARSRHTGRSQFTNLTEWDNERPPKEYFELVAQKSLNQIIWGGNYFSDLVPPSSCWIVWLKNAQCFSPAAADCEIAWTSFSTAIRFVRFDWSGFGFINAKEPRIHPTQKPVALYKWLLTNYAKPGDKILDTHLGSGSSRIAAWDLGFDFYATELDKDYFEAQEKRFADHIAQPNMLAEVEPLAEQMSLTMEE